MRSPTVSSRTLEIAVATAAAEAGLPLATVSTRAGLDPALLGDPAARVPHEVLVATWEALAAGDDAFGLRAARLVETMGRSIFEYAILNATDARGALACFLRFQRLMHDASAHTLEERAATAVLRVGLAPPLLLPAAVGDFLAAMLVLRFRVLLQRPVEPVLVRLSRPAPDGRGIAAGIFRGPVAYGAPRVEIHWPRCVLDQALSSADPTLHLVLGRELERALGLPFEPRESPRARGDEDVAARLKRALRTALARGDTSLGTVARTIGMSGRSLERRLSARGTSYQEVRDAVRRSITEELLVVRGANVTEAALATGFSEVAAFTRAFRRWTGMAPSELLRARAAAGGGASGAPPGGAASPTSGSRDPG
jgi:AraC-like DNA-binding protein